METKVPVPFDETKYSGHTDLDFMRENHQGWRAYLTEFSPLKMYERICFDVDAYNQLTMMNFKSEKSGAIKKTELVRKHRGTTRGHKAIREMLTLEVNEAVVKPGDNPEATAARCGVN